MPSLDLACGPRPCQHYRRHPWISRNHCPTAEMKSSNRVCLYYSMRMEAEANGCPEERLTGELERLIFETQYEPATIALYDGCPERPWLSRRILCLLADYHGVPWPEFRQEPGEPVDWEPSEPKRPRKRVHPWGADAVGQLLRYHRSQLAFLRGVLRDVDMAQVPGPHYQVLTGPSMDSVLRSMQHLANQMTLLAEKEGGSND